MRRIVSLLAICAALVSCGNTGGKSTGDEFQSINWRDNDAAAVICVGMYTKESDLRDSWLLERYSKSYGLENLETVQTKGDEWYIVIPRHSKATVKVNAVEIDENCNLHKSMLLAERDGRPFLLRCNVSDLYCNVAISIEGKDGKPLVDYSPMISLKDGSVVTPDDDGDSATVLDITDKFLPIKPSASADYIVHEYTDSYPIKNKITARVQDGKAFVRLSRGIDECPEGEYEIEDLSGKCRGVFIGNIGQDINPIVCLAMENGGLEIFSLFSATQTGRFDSSGPLDGFKDIEAFKDSTVVDTVNGEFAGAYVTIFALDKNGDAKEIELNPIAITELSFLQNHDDGRTIEHKIVLTHDWKITYSTAWFEGDPIEEYRGHVRLLKYDYDSIVLEQSYAFSEHLSYDQDMMAASEKVSLKGTFRMTHQKSGYQVVPLSGPLTFGTQDTGSAFYEYTFLRDLPQSDSGEEAE